MSKSKRILVIHCSATPASMDVGVKQIRRWHTAPPPIGNGWSDIGYHRVIRRSGTSESGRPLDTTPAAQKGFNRNSIAICLVGGVDKVGGKPKDNFTDRQLTTLIHEIAYMRNKYDVVSIVGHRDFPDVSKACPSFNVTEWVYQNLLGD